MASFYLALLMALFASILPEVVLREFAGQAIPVWLPYFKMGALLIAAIVFRRWKKEHRSLGGFALVLAAFVALHHTTRLVLGADWYQQLFSASSRFVASVGSQVLLKLIIAVPTILLLLWLYGKHRNAYLVAGNLAAEAEAMPAFGIKGNRISWGRLAVLSGLAIGGGTLLLTLLTVTGFRAPDNIGALPRSLPVIILFALVNSFSEGIVFRNNVLASLSKTLPKAQLMLVGALFFGVGHYYGAPQGVVGVAMSSVLGWYLCRSMYETKGFLAPWIIHFVQDVVIFSAMVALTVG